MKYQPSRRILNEASSIVQRNMLPGGQYRIVGPQVVRLAVHRYNLQTAVVFGILCLVIATAVSSYIFKTVRVAVMTYLIVGIVVVWILAFMSLSGIPLTSTTALSFGLVLVVSLATTIRIVTHFNERYQIVQNRKEAMRQALGVVLVPCLICSTTTAVGFGTTMVSSIPMVFQFGLIMSLGVMLSFVVSVLVTTALLTSMRPIKPRSYERMAGDFVAQFLARMKNAIFNHYRLVTAVGLVFTVVMFASIPLIRSDTQILRMLSASTQEVKDLQFVEEQLTAVHSLELLIEAQEGTFKSADAWKKVAELDEKLQRIPEVVSTDSFLPLLEHLQSLLGDSRGLRENLFSNPALLPQLLMLTSLSNEGRRLTSRYLDDGSGRLHISVRIKNSAFHPDHRYHRGCTLDCGIGHGRARANYSDRRYFRLCCSSFCPSQITDQVSGTGIYPHHRIADRELEVCKAGARKPYSEHSSRSAHLRHNGLDGDFS